MVDRAKPAAFTTSPQPERELNVHGIEVPIRATVVVFNARTSSACNGAHGRNVVNAGICDVPTGKPCKVPTPFTCKVLVGGGHGHVCMRRGRVCRVCVRRGTVCRVCMCNLRMHRGTLHSLPKNKYLQSNPL